MLREMPSTFNRASNPKPAFGAYVRCGTMRVCLPLIFLLLTATAAAQPADSVVARVNDVPITVARFNSSYVQRLIQTGANDTPGARYAHLNDLIDAYLLGQEARRRGLEDAEFEGYIGTEIKKVLGGRFFEVAFADSLPEPSEPEVRDAFRKTNETVILRHLFFRHPDSARAAYARLENGADFLQVANDVFETSSFDSLAGYLGEADYWDLDDAVALAAFDLAPGEYSAPVQSKFGWHILRLEDRLRNPLLTESEFQRRRKDISHRVRARRFRLEGDRFVKTFMDSLSVEINEGALADLHAVIQGALSGQTDPSMPRVNLEPEEVVSIEEEFSGESVLATYEMDGETRSFRAHQYFEWLEDLPYAEVKNRTVASVGRALRNEALAERGLSMGFQEDPAVRQELQHRALTFLADRLREKLRVEADVDPTEVELREAYQRLDFRTLKRAQADYWHLKFASLAEAEAAKNNIERGTDPESYESFVAYEDRDLTELGELGTYVRKAPIESPVVVGTGDGGWHVIRIENRTIEYVEFDEARPDIERQVGPYLPELRLTQELREEADIFIDHELFRNMMELRSKEAES